MRADCPAGGCRRATPSGGEPGVKKSALTGTPIPVAGVGHRQQVGGTRAARPMARGIGWVVVLIVAVLSRNAIPEEVVPIVGSEPWWELRDRAAAPFLGERVRREAPAVLPDVRDAAGIRPCIRPRVALARGVVAIRLQQPFELAADAHLDRRGQLGRRGENDAILVGAPGRTRRGAYERNGGRRHRRG